MGILPPKIQIDFTDELIDKGGLTFLARFVSLLNRSFLSETQRNEPPRVFRRLYYVSPVSVIEALCF